MNSAERNALILAAVPLVHKSARRYLTDDQDELIQDALVTIVKRIDQFRGDCALATWVYTVVRTTFLMRKRRLRQRRRLAVLTPLTGMLADLLPDDSPLPDEQIDTVQRITHLYRKRARLDKMDVALLHAHYDQEEPIEVIAARLRLKPQTIKSKLFRARQRLRSKLVAA